MLGNENTPLASVVARCFMVLSFRFVRITLARISGSLPLSTIVPDIFVPCARMAADKASNGKVSSSFLYRGFIVKSLFCRMLLAFTAMFLGSISAVIA